MIKSMRFRSLLAILGLMFTSCSPSQITPPSSTRTVSVTPTNAATNQAKLTVSPTLATPSPTETSTLLPYTPTPQPTLDEARTKEMILELLKTNGDCKLPCFWGITPGKTALDEGKKFFEHLGWKGKDYKTFSSPDETFYGTLGEVDSHGITVMIYPKNGIVEIVSAGFGGRNFKTLMPYYTIERVLLMQGIPSQIYVNLATGLEVSTPQITDYNLEIFYQQTQILLTYSGSAVKIADSYRLCPTNPNQGNPNAHEDEGSVGMTLGVPGRGKTPEELLNPFGQFGNPLTIDKALGINADEFYQKITQGKVPVCFLTPRNVWP